MVQLSTGPKETPPSASSRAYLRDGLPSLYPEGDFGMRFVGALESCSTRSWPMLDGAPRALRPRPRAAATS